MKKNAVVEYMEEMAKDGWYVDHCNVNPDYDFPDLGMAQFVMVNDAAPGYRLTITGCHVSETIVRLRDKSYRIIAEGRI